MPIYKDFSTAHTHVLIWKYDENEVLDPQVLLEEENREKVLDYHPHKVAEMLMVRQMLKTILPTHKILYRENGEPYLEPDGYQISISHSFPLAAIAISKRKVGIDLEKVKSKIVRIKHKFVLNETSFIKEEQEELYLTSIWCVKEALYKIHHSKHWSLKKHYDVMPYDIENNITVGARVYEESEEDFFTAKITFFDDYCFAIVQE